MARFFFIMILVVFSSSNTIAQARLNLPPVETFTLKWTPSGGSELGSSQLFLNEFCDLLQAPKPSSPKNISQITTKILKFTKTIHPIITSIMDVMLVTPSKI